MAPSSSPELRIHTTLGGRNEVGFQIASAATRATVSDPYAVTTDRALAAIGRQRELLNELELALMALKTEREVSGQAEAA